ncbi:hypothetical protein FOZ60_002846 [Perkinsus olseni]|nr:hypothetical protein FOZ60_002846 [Perkinsus olseni]
MKRARPSNPPTPSSSPLGHEESVAAICDVLVPQGIAEAEEAQRGFQNGAGLHQPAPGKRVDPPTGKQLLVAQALQAAAVDFDLPALLVNRPGPGFLSPAEASQFDSVFDEAATSVRSVLCGFLSCEDRSSRGGAPFRGPLWIALLDTFADDDSTLREIIDRPFPAGILNKIPEAPNMPPFSISQTKLDREPGDLRPAFTNYRSAQDVPEAIIKAIDAEVDAGRMVFVDLPLEEAIAKGYRTVKVAAVPKKDGDWRLVEDYRRGGTNRMIDPTRCPNTTVLPSYADLMQILRFVAGFPSDTYKTLHLDFAKAYRHVKVNAQERRFLCVLVPDASGSYTSPRIAMHTSFPFGLRSSAVAWGRVAAAAFRLAVKLADIDEDLPLLGYCYVDDLVFWIPSRVYNIIAPRLLLVFATLGLWINWRKVATGCTTGSCLGFQICLRSPGPHHISVSLPADKVSTILDDIQAMLSARHTNLSTARRLAGRLVWASQAYRLLRPYLCHLFSLVQFLESGAQAGTVGRQLKRDLRLWAVALQSTVPVLPGAPNPRYRCLSITDASTSGLGGVVRLQTADGDPVRTMYFCLPLTQLPGYARRLLLRGQAASSSDMCTLEILSAALGIVLALRMFNTPRDVDFVTVTDSSATAHALRKVFSGKPRMSLILRAVATRLASRCLANKPLKVATIYSEENLTADLVSRGRLFSVPPKWVAADGLELLAALDLAAASE